MFFAVVSSFIMLTKFDAIFLCSVLLGRYSSLLPSLWPECYMLSAILSGVSMCCELYCLYCALSVLCAVCIGVSMNRIYPCRNENCTGVSMNKLWSCRDEKLYRRVYEQTVVGGSAHKICRRICDQNVSAQKIYRKGSEYMRIWNI